MKEENFEINYILIIFKHEVIIYNYISTLRIPQMERNNLQNQSHSLNSLDTENRIGIGIGC
jgi:hypothetical protein